MTKAVLLDTHVALWLDSGSDCLRPATRTLIDECWIGGGTVFLSAGTEWEIAQLVDTGRIDLDRSIEDWLERFTARPGVEALPPTPVTAARSYRLHQLDNRDPGDRLLIATAIEQACPLVTYDERIVRFSQSHGSQYGFVAVG